MKGVVVLNGISIVIPVYNTKKYLIDRCVKSITDNNYHNCEVIFVDDGSDKDIAEYLDNVAALESNYRVCHQPNSGAAVARNTGTKYAKYDYITYIDSDDLIASNMLSEAERYIERCDPDIAIGLVKHQESLESISSEEILRGEDAEVRILDTRFQIEEYLNHLLGYRSEGLTYKTGYIADGPVSKIIKTKIAKNITFPSDNCWNEDTLWNIKISNACNKIVIVPNIWYLYIVNEASQTQRFRVNCIREFTMRVQQEYQVAEKLFDINNLPGIYVRMWADMAIVFRTYIAHQENREGFFKRFSSFKSLCRNDAYCICLRNVNFCYEGRAARRLIKRIITFSMSYGTGLIAYGVWSYISRKSF